MADTGADIGADIGADVVTDNGADIGADVGADVVADNGAEIVAGQTAPIVPKCVKIPACNLWRNRLMASGPHMTRSPLGHRPHEAPAV